MQLTKQFVSVESLYSFCNIVPRSTDGWQYDKLQFLSSATNFFACHSLSQSRMWIQKYVILYVEVILTERKYKKLPAVEITLLNESVYQLQGSVEAFKSVYKDKNLPNNGNAGNMKVMVPERQKVITKFIPFQLLMDSFAKHSGQYFKVNWCHRTTVADCDLFRKRWITKSDQLTQSANSESSWTGGKLQKQPTRTHQLTLQSAEMENATKAKKHNLWSKAPQSLLAQETIPKHNTYQFLRKNSCKYCTVLVSGRTICTSDLPPIGKAKPREFTPLGVH